MTGLAIFGESGRPGQRHVPTSVPLLEYAGDESLLTFGGSSPGLEFAPNPPHALGIPWWCKVCARVFILRVGMSFVIPEGEGDSRGGSEPILGTLVTPDVSGLLGYLPTSWGVTSEAVMFWHMVVVPVSMPLEKCC